LEEEAESPSNLPGLFEPPEKIELHYFSDKSILRELILQIRKDFELSGIALKLLLSKQYSFNELSMILSDGFMKMGATAMFQILYRVDVSEQQLQKGMPTPGIDTKLIAELVIKRELQKVVLRRFYRAHKA
jgi:hypothetical protein